MQSIQVAWKQVVQDGGGKEECERPFIYNKDDQAQPCIDRRRGSLSRKLTMTFALVLLAVLAIFSHGRAFPWGRSNGLGNPLRFARDGTFQISIFEDLHYGEGESSSGPESTATDSF